MQFRLIAILVAGLLFTVCLVFLFDFAADKGVDGALEVGVEGEVESPRSRDGNSLNPRRVQEEGPVGGPTLSTQEEKLTETWFSVVVRDTKGDPVKDAFVEMARSMNMSDLRQPFDYGFTDKNGRFRCRLQIRSTTVVVNRDRASKKQLSSESERIWLVNEEEQSVEIVLKPCDGSLVVLAVTPLGEPVKNVLIRIRGKKSRTGSSGRTNKMGEVLFDHLLPQDFVLYGESKSSSPKVEDPEWRVVTVDAGSRSAERVVLPAFGRVKVRMRLIGKKLGLSLNVHVAFAGMDDPSRKPVSCNLEAPGETTINLIRGKLRVFARCIQRARAFLAVVETPTIDVGRDGVAECVIAIYTSGHTLNGKVVDVDGNPVPGIGITASVTNDQLRGTQGRIVTKSTADGTFMFPALPPGQINVRPETRSYRNLGGPFQYAVYGHASSLQETYRTDVGEILVVLERGYRVNVRFSEPLRGGESLTLETHPYGKFPMDKAMTHLNFNHLYRGKYRLTLKAKSGEILRQRSVDFGTLKDDVFVLDVDL